jgi:hypothetical protein
VFFFGFRLLRVGIFEGILEKESIQSFPLGLCGEKTQSSPGMLESESM